MTASKAAFTSEKDCRSAELGFLDLDVEVHISWTIDRVEECQEVDEFILRSCCE